MSSAADFAETIGYFEEQVIAKRDFASLARVYTKTARILPPGGPMMTGLEQIEAFWKNAPAALDMKCCKLATIEAEFIGDSAIEIGASTITQNSGSTIEVKYVVVWKKEDGLWKWDIDIWNPVS